MYILYVYVIGMCTHTFIQSSVVCDKREREGSMGWNRRYEWVLQLVGVCIPTFLSTWAKRGPGLPTHHLRGNEPSSWLQPAFRITWSSSPSPYRRPFQPFPLKVWVLCGCHLRRGRWYTQMWMIWPALCTGCAYQGHTLVRKLPGMQGPEAAQHKSLLQAPCKPSPPPPKEPRGLISTEYKKQIGWQTDDGWTDR